MSEPRVTVMGEEVPWDQVPGTGAVGLADHFKAVKISPKAIDQVSKIVPREVWLSEGLHTWLFGRANYVFSKLTSEQTKGKYGKLVYVFHFEYDGPLLAAVYLEDI